MLVQQPETAGCYLALRREGAKSAADYFWQFAKRKEAKNFGNWFGMI